MDTHTCLYTACTRIRMYEDINTNRKIHKPMHIYIYTCIYINTKHVCMCIYIYIDTCTDAFICLEFVRLFIQFDLACLLARGGS